jgi:hypothetical protein
VVEHTVATAANGIMRTGLDVLALVAAVVTGLLWDVHWKAEPTMCTDVKPDFGQQHAYTAFRP